MVVATMDIVLGWVAFLAVFASVPGLAFLFLWNVRRQQRGLERRPLELFRELRLRGQISHAVYDRLRREFQE